MNGWQRRSARHIRTQESDLEGKLMMAKGRGAERATAHRQCPTATTLRREYTVRTRPRVPSRYRYRFLQCTRMPTSQRVLFSAVLFIRQCCSAHTMARGRCLLRMIFENDLECFGVYISVDLCQDSRVKCHLISHTANTEQSRSRDRTRNPLPGPARANAAPESNPEKPKRKPEPSTPPSPRPQPLGGRPSAATAHHPTSNLPTNPTRPASKQKHQSMSMKYDPTSSAPECGNWRGSLIPPTY